MIRTHGSEFVCTECQCGEPIARPVTLDGEVQREAVNQQVRRMQDEHKDCRDTRPRVRDLRRFASEWIQSPEGVAAVDESQRLAVETVELLRKAFDWVTII